MPTRARTILAASLLASVACSGCDSSSEGGGGGGGAQGQGGAPGEGGGLPDPPSISWAPCADEAVAGFDCADVPVPLDWADARGPAMTVRLRRRLAVTDPPRGSLWMLEGGPGAPGAWMLTFADRTAVAHPDLDILVVDHRGTGESGELRCDPSTDPPSLECLTELAQSDGPAIAATSASASARDVAALAQWFGRGQTQLLYGRSYGTFWAHRTVSLAPSVFDAVVLEGPCDAIRGCPSFAKDHDFDQVGRAFFALCDEDAACRARLPGGAEAFVEETIAAADAGACEGAFAAGLTGDRMRLALARLISTKEGRALAPALVFRYARCSAADVTALTTTAAWLDTLETLFATLPGFSVLANYHVMRADFWDGSFSVADAEAQLADTVVASGASVRWAKAFEAWPWPVPDVDPSLRAWRFSSAPVLVLTGGLDTATPPRLLAALEDALPAGSTWVEQPLAGHVASAAEDPTSECARTILDAFLDDPAAPLDLQCVAAADATERAALFAVDAETSQTWLGTESAYD